MSIYFADDVMEAVFSNWGQKIDGQVFHKLQDMHKGIHHEFESAIEVTINNDKIKTQFLEFLNTVHPTFVHNMQAFEVLEELTLLKEIKLELSEFGGEDIPRAWRNLLRRMGKPIVDNGHDEGKYKLIYYNYVGFDNKLGEFDALRLFLSGKRGIVVQLDVYNFILNMIFEFNEDYLEVE